VNHTLFRYAQKFWGSFVSLIQNSSILLLLVEDIRQPEKSLRWQYFDQKFDEHHSFLVNTQDIPISSWLSVAVLAANITAVYWDDNELRVGFYHLSWDSDNLVLHNHIPGNQSSSSTSVSLGDGQGRASGAGGGDSNGPCSSPPPPGRTTVCCMRTSARPWTHVV